MPSGNIQIHHDFSAVAQKVIIVIYENSNLGAEIDRAVLDTPHIAGTVTIFDNLNLVLHRVKCHQSSDGVTLETLLHSWTVQAKRISPVSKPFWYKVDRGSSGVNPDWSDPISGHNSVIDTRWSDADNVVLSKDGGAELAPGVHYNLLPGGGWSLKPGDVFSADEWWTAIAFWNVAVVDSGTGAAGQSGIHVVEDDGDFNSTYFNKKNIAAFTGEIGTTDFPAFSTIANKVGARFSTYTGAQRYWVLQFSAGDTVRYKGEDKNVIWLGKGEYIELFWDTDPVSGLVKGYVVDSDGIGYGSVGQRLLVDRWDVGGNNGNLFLLDGTQYDIADVPRIYHEHVEKLPAGQVVTEAVWQADLNKRHFYAVDALAGKVRFPDDRNMYYRGLAIVDGSVPAGTYEADMVGPHVHPVKRAQTAFTGVNDGAAAGSNGIIDGTILTGTTGSINASGMGAETRVKTVRQYAVVYI
jgi:hypothetical protein